MILLLVNCEEFRPSIKDNRYLSHLNLLFSLFWENLILFLSLTEGCISPISHISSSWALRSKESNFLWRILEKFPWELDPNCGLSCCLKIMIYYYCSSLGLSVTSSISSLILWNSSFSLSSSTSCIWGWSASLKDNSLELSMRFVSIQILIKNTYSPSYLHCDRSDQKNHFVRKFLRSCQVLLLYFNGPTFGIKFFLVSASVRINHAQFIQNIFWIIVAQSF